MLQELDRFEDALASYRAALAYHPNFVDALRNKAGALRELNRADEAVAVFDQAIALDPGHAMTFSNRGVALRAAGRLQEALTSIDRALELDPGNIEVLNNRGGALVALGLHTEGIDTYRRIITAHPDVPEVHYNIGVALQHLGRHAESLDAYSRAIELRPDYVNAHFNRSLSRLVIGDFEQGWPEYEWRWQTTQLRKYRRDLVGAPWFGKPSIEGKTILLYAEQGFGDTLQMCRYVPLIAAQADVVLEVPGNMVRLMTTLNEGGHIIAAGEPLPDFDLHCPLLSLPLAVGTTPETIPAKEPYLRAGSELAAAWRARLADMSGLRIGLVWSSGLRFHDPDILAFGRTKSTTLRQLAPLAQLPQVTLVSLQKGDGAEQAASPPDGMRIHDWTGELHDFADTAALIDALDLVISVDTAVAHLAGALGKPIWLLNRYDSSWQWMPGPDDSPWYPTLRQFRQPAPGDWAGAVARITDALRDLPRSALTRF